MKPKKKRKPKTTHGKKRIIYGVLGFLMACACGALIFYGLAAEKRQSDVMDELPDLIDNMIDFKDEAVERIQNVSDICTSIKDQLDTLPNSIKTNFAADIADIKNQIDEAIDAIEEITEELNDVPLDDIKEKFGDKVEDYNDDRHKVVTGTLGLLIGILFVRLLLMFLNGHGPNCLRPSKSIPCKIFSQLLTIIILLLILLTWIISGILLFGSSVAADFCITPDTNIISLDESLDDPNVQFFLQCDETNAANPITTPSVTSDLFDGLDDAKTEVDNFRTQTEPATCYPAINPDSDCDDAFNILGNISVSITSLKNSLGVDLVGPDANFETGVLSLANCTNLNGKYQSILNAVCGTFFDALTKFFETFAAFACLFVALEFLKRRYPNSLEDDDEYDSNRPDQQFVPNANTEMTKYDVNKNDEMNFYPAPTPPPYNQPPSMADPNAGLYPDLDTNRYDDVP